MDDPDPACAMCTSLTVRGALPKALDSCRRAVVPLMLVCTICRIVCPPNASPPASGAVAHVPVQYPLVGFAAAAWTGAAGAA